MPSFNSKLVRLKVHKQHDDAVIAFMRFNSKLVRLKVLPAKQ